MTKAFAYLRVSGKSQVDGDGFTRQLTAIQQYAKAHDIRIVQIFREEGICGKTEWDHRPAWMEMVESFNGVRTVIIEKLDRLARDLMVQEHIIDDFRKRGIALISVMEPDLCVDDPSRVFMRQVFGAMAQYDKTMIVLKLKGARQRKKASAGRCEGRKPYGHYPGETEVLVEMREWHDRDGLPLATIATRLNERGVKPRMGKQWYPQTVGRILARKG